MNKKPITFTARVVRSSRKKHDCFGCGKLLPAGSTYIAYPGENSEGKFGTTHFCIECSFLLTQKTGANAYSIREGEFCDRLIPNFLRKKRAEFRKNMKAAIESAGLMRSTPQDLSCVNRIVVKTSEFNRRIFHLPESRYKKEQFPKGKDLVIRAGVNRLLFLLGVMTVWSIVRTATRRKTVKNVKSECSTGSTLRQKGIENDTGRN